MPPLRLGGLASGLDTEAVLAQLLAAERGPRVRYERQADVVEARKTALSDIASRLRALKTAVADLRSPTLFTETQTVETSDASRVGVTRTGGVGTGAYAVRVHAVAAAEQQRYTFTTQAGASSISLGGHSTALAAGATIDDAVAAVNADKDAKVWASKTGTNEVVFSWRDTGDVADGVRVTGDALTFSSMVREGRNADYEIDGTRVTTSASNTITSLPGLSLTLKAPTAADVQITVGPPGPDTTKVKDKVKAFVEAYNNANDLLRTELREEKVRDAANRVDRGKGVLRGDPALTTLQSQLRQALQTVVGSTAAADQLADLGITTGAASAGAVNADAVNGKLVLDEAKLSETLAANPTAVKELLGATGSGVAQAFEAILERAVGTDGAFAERAKSADAELTRIRSSMTRFDERLELREKNLRAMFTRLEAALAQSQSQGSQLGAQLARL
jgi:flagellar hook-associated protein 2